MTIRFHYFWPKPNGLGEIYIMSPPEKVFWHSKAHWMAMAMMCTLIYARRNMNCQQNILLRNFEKDDDDDDTRA